MTIANCSDLIAVRGTKVFMSTTLPDMSGNDSAVIAAYDGLTWVEVGMIDQIGEFGAEGNVGSFTPLGTGVACKYRGTTDNGELPLTIAKTTDTGLSNLVDREGQSEMIALKIELSERGTHDPAHTTPAKYHRYLMSGLVRRARIVVGSGDDVVKVNAAIAINGRIFEGAKANSVA